MFYQAMIPCKNVLLLMFAIASPVRSSGRGNDDWQQTISNNGSSSSGQQPTRIMDEVDAVNSPPMAPSSAHRSAQTHPPSQGPQMAPSLAHRSAQTHPPSQGPQIPQTPYMMTDSQIQASSSHLPHRASVGRRRKMTDDQRAQISSMLEANGTPAAIPRSTTLDEIRRQKSKVTSQSHPVPPSSQAHRMDINDPSSEIHYQTSQSQLHRTMGPLPRNSQGQFARHHEQTRPPDLITIVDPSQFRSVVQQMTSLPSHRIAPSSQAHRMDRLDGALHNLMTERSERISTVKHFDELLAGNNSNASTMQSWTLLKNKHIKRLKEIDSVLAPFQTDAPFSALTAPSIPPPPPAAVALNAPSSSTLLQQPSEHVVPAAVVASIMPSSSVLHHPTLPPAAGGPSLNLSEQNVSQILQRTNARRAQPGSAQPAPSHPSTPFGQAPSQPVSNYAAPSQQRQLDFDDKLRSLMAERDELTTRLMHINGIPEETIHGGNKANRTKYINKFNRRINEIDDTLARINSTRRDTSISSQHGSGMVMPSQQQMVAGPSSRHPSHPSPSFGNSRDGYMRQQPLQTASGAVATSAYQLEPLPQSLEPSQLQQTSAQPAAEHSTSVDPFGHLNLGETINYADQASSWRDQMQTERDHLRATMHSITGMEEYSLRLQQIENLEQEINSANVMVQSLNARAEQLSERIAGPSYRQNIASTYSYGQSSHQQNAGHMAHQQNALTMPSIQADPSQLYNLPSASMHGNHYSGPSAAGVSFQGDMSTLAGGLPPSSIIGSPSEQWRNADPSGITRGTQASVGQQSFNLQQPSNRADVSLPNASANQSTMIRAPSTIRAPSSSRAPSGQHSAGSSGQIGRIPPSESP